MVFENLSQHGIGGGRERRYVRHKRGKTLSESSDGGNRSDKKTVTKKAGFTTPKAIYLSGQVAGDDFWRHCLCYIIFYNESMRIKT